MSWTVLLTLGAGSYVLRILGLALLGDREVAPWLLTALRLIPVALLTALIAVQTVGGPDGGFAFDARVTGVVAAAIAVMLRASFLAVLAVAVVVTGLTRALGWG
jgi:branched-subunit amino acid transport protein